LNSKDRREMVDMIFHHVKETGNREDDRRYGNVPLKRESEQHAHVATMRENIIVTKSDL
jgi:hypothetical protein